MTSKELDALKRLLDHCDTNSEYYILDNDLDDYEFIKSAIERLEKLKKDLEVLEIFKNNEISISYIEQSKSYNDYISSCDIFRNLSYIKKEEYTLLKEWLEND